MSAAARSAGHDDPPGDRPAESVMELIRDAGGRATAARRIILEALIAAGGHCTAEELAAGVKAAHPELHESTVYRTLDRFEQLGVAYHTHLGHGAAQWHLSRDVHQHLVCQDCGGVVEADPEVFRAVARYLLTEYGFHVELHHFALTGRCAACAGPAVNTVES
jgi:Fur family transcriptional regulator, ferric uptake regulator